MISKRTLITTAAFSLTFCASAVAQSNTSEKPRLSGSNEYVPSVGQDGKDVIWVPTSQTLVDRMLNMAELTANDQLDTLNLKAI